MTSKSVKAWFCKGGYPQGLHQTNINIPSAITAINSTESSDMIVKITAAAINPVDIQAMNVRTWKSYIPGLATPVNTGRDFAGIIVNGASTGFVAGDQVIGLTFAGGTLAETGQFDCATTAVVKKPPSWTAEQGAAIPLVWLTARTCIEDVAPFINPTTSKRLVVLGGSSSTGIYTIKIAKQRGWKVLATSSAKNKSFVLDELHADKHVDYTAENVRKAVSAYQPDAIIDCVGGTECVGIPGNKRYITIVGDKHSRATMGGPFTYYDYTHPFVMSAQWLRWARGQVGLGESYDVVILALKKEWLEEATRLRPEEIYIDSTFAFEDTPKAFERLDTGRARGKVVVTVAR